jgi:hypothetical protein
VIAPIEESASTAYTMPMRSAVLRLVALIAMLLMPLGMSAVPAVVHHGRAAAAMPMQHCPDQGSKPSLKGGFAECTMACSATLPAAYPADKQPLPVICAPAAPTAARALNGLHPDTATPPPKVS